MLFFDFGLYLAKCNAANKRIAGQVRNPGETGSKKYRGIIAGGMKMEQFSMISERIFYFVEWGWKSFGWWFVLGSLSCTLIIGLGIFRSPNR